MKKNKLKIQFKFILLFILNIMFISTFNETSSRYLGQLAADKDVVAIPIITLDNNDLTYNVDNMLPGDVKEYSFIVSNKENEKLNEILLSYHFKITSNSKIPFNYKLFDSNNREITIDNGISTDERMDYGIETSRNYKLQIIWNKTDNDISYAGTTANINILLEAVQVV